MLMFIKNKHKEKQKMSIELGLDTHEEPRWHRHRPEDDSALRRSEKAWAGNGEVIGRDTGPFASHAIEVARRAGGRHVAEGSPVPAEMLPRQHAAYVEVPGETPAPDQIPTVEHAQPAPAELPAPVQQGDHPPTETARLLAMFPPHDVK
jgi:hypothetical protein